MEKKRKTFLVYSWSDKEFALKLARELKAEGFSVWLDILDIPPGARLDDQFEKAMTESDVFMVIITKASVVSGNVLAGIFYGTNQGKNMLPVLLEKADIPLELLRYQYVDFTDRPFANGVQSTIELLRNLVGPMAPREQKSSSPDKQPLHVSKERQNKPRKVLKSSNPKKKANVGQIFISYRRSDSEDIAGRIYDRLVDKFGKELIFKDVDAIPLGLDFKEYLDRKVGECDVLLAIIGDRWVDASDSTGKRRLHDPADFVRIEIQSALARDIPVIPLFVRGAQIPSKESLPTSLRKLIFRNGIPIRSDPDFHRDMDRLITALEKLDRKEK